MIVAQNACLIKLQNEKIKLFRAARSSRHTTGRTVLLAAVFFSLWLGGCSSQNLNQIKDQNDFDRLLIQSKQPVLVDFYKDGCPTCVILEPKLVKLAEEYQGRVTFTRFKLMEAYFAVKAPDLKERYDISYFPTVILFVDGQEKTRWVLSYDMEKYRQVLDETVGPGKVE